MLMELFRSCLLGDRLVKALQVGNAVTISHSQSAPSSQSSSKFHPTSEVKSKNTRANCHLKNMGNCEAKITNQLLWFLFYFIFFLKET
jgi:hypothetical protein